MKRRQLLRGGTVALLAGLSGCSMPFGDDSDIASGDPMDWVAESMGGIRDGKGFGVQTLTSAYLAEQDEWFPELDVQGSFEEKGIEIDRVTTVHREDSGFEEDFWVLEGSFGADDIRSLSETDGELQENGEYEGFERYRTDTEAVMAIHDDGVALRARSDEWLEAGIDARRGSEPRAVGTNDDFAYLVDAVGPMDKVQIGIGENYVETDRLGIGFDVRDAADQSMAVRAVYLYDDEGAAGANEEAVRSRLPFGDITDPIVTVEGRTVVVEGTVPYEDVFGEPPEQPPDELEWKQEGRPPEAEFFAAPDRDDQLLSIRHLEGDWIPAKELSIGLTRFDDEVSGPWHAVPGSEFAPDDLVGPGDVLEIDLPAVDGEQPMLFRMTIHWTSPRDDESVVLFKRRVPY